MFDLVNSKWFGIATGFAVGAGVALMGGRYRGGVPWSWLPNASLKRPITSSTPGNAKNIKAVVVVRTDLGMRKGKIAAQCSHAIVGIYRIASKQIPDVVEDWINAGQTIVVLGMPDEGEEGLISLSEKAKAAGLVSCWIRDAGRTQIARGSMTVLGIGPAPADQIGALTERFKLL